MHANYSALLKAHFDKNAHAAYVFIILFAFALGIIPGDYCDFVGSFDSLRPSQQIFSHSGHVFLG